jgi:hypothetical protein
MYVSLKIVRAALGWAAGEQNVRGDVSYVIGVAGVGGIVVLCERPTWE